MLQEALCTTDNCTGGNNLLTLLSLAPLRGNRLVKTQVTLTCRNLRSQSELLTATGANSDRMSRDDRGAESAVSTQKQMSKGSTRGRGGRQGGRPSGGRPPAARPAPNQEATVKTPTEAGTTARPVGKTGASRPNQPPRRKKASINWVWVVASIGIVALLGAWVYNLYNELRVITGVQTYGPYVGGLHVDGEVNYTETPPVGGEHRAAWQNCGIYDDPVQDELAVHALEHGAVWITYQPDLPAEQIEQLKSLVRGKTYTLLSPYPDQPSAVAASAWGAQLTADNAGDARLGSFLAKYRQGSQTPEPGAACVGGVGSPDER